MSTKEELRKRFKQKRSRLTEEEEVSLNKDLLSQFRIFNWSRFNYVHIFLPIRRFREPDTRALIDWMQSNFPQMQLVIPKTDMEYLKMDHYVLEENQVYELNNWGIKEPKSGELISPEQLDVVLVPLLAFDRMGNRVGYGKGFYDRFLSACRPDCLKIGLSLFEPVNRIEDTNPLDIPLNYCITPNTIWEFRVF